MCRYQIGHSTVRITLDIYGHLFNDVNFTRQQVELLEGFFGSARNPLENAAEDEKTLVIDSQNNLELLRN